MSFERFSARLLRWAEVGDLPVAAAASLTVILTAAMCSSCGTLFPDRGTGVGARPSGPAGERAARWEGEPQVRVRIASDLDGVEIGGPPRAAVGPASRSGEARYVQTPVTITRAETGWHVKDAGGQTLAFASASPGDRREALSVKGVGPRLLSINSKVYPGEVTLLPATGGTGVPAGGVSASRFDAVAAMGIESYLPGVIAKELMNGWSLTTFKAQAIAARTYALHERERSQKLGESFDLESSELDQVYDGSVVNATAQRAVRDTRGSVLTFQGRLLRAYFSSTCGGRSASAKDVWPTTKGFEFNLDAPIQGQGADDPCAASPLYRWTVSRTREDLSKRLSAYGRDQGLGVKALKSVSKLEPSLFNAFGRPSQYKVYDSDGTWWPLSAEQLRAACNWTGSSGLPGVTRQTRVNSGDAEFRLDAKLLTINGRGFGHGVGLCQYGAEALARQGKEAADILMHYYPGAKIERAY